MKRSPAGRVLQPQPQPEPEQPEEEDAEQRKRREVEAIWLEIDADRSGGLDRQVQSHRPAVAISMRQW
eukprot:COSAG04_NODE_2100_length_4781_cov_8.111064_5_plen_68_part_00